MALGRSGWNCMACVLLAFSPAGGWYSENRTPFIVTTAREKGVNIVEVPLPHTTGKPLARC